MKVNTAEDWDHVIDAAEERREELIAEAAGRAQVLDNRVDTTRRDYEQLKRANNSFRELAERRAAAP